MNCGSTGSPAKEKPGIAGVSPAIESVASRRGVRHAAPTFSFVREVHGTSPTGTFLRKVHVLILIFLVSGTLFSCSSNKVLDEKETISVGMPWEPRTFNPFRSVDSASYSAQSLVFSGLLRYNSQGEIEGDLADSFELKDSVYRFHLRQGLKFSDGSRIEPSDVVSSIKEAASERSPFRSNFRLMESVSADGEFIVVKLTGTDASLPARFVDLKILPLKVLKANKEDKARYEREPVSSGAFKLKSWIAGQQLIFERNPFYWDKQAEYKNLAWRVIPDKKLLAMALVRDEIDIASIDGREVEQLLKQDSKLKVEKVKGARIVFLGFNTTKYPFNDKRVRQALLMSLDRKKINRSLFGNYSEITDSEFSSRNRESMFSYNPKQASEKLILSGFEKRNSIWFSKEKEKDLTVKVVTVKDFVDLGQVVVSSLKRFQVNAQLEIVEYSTLKDQYLKTGEFDTVLFSRSIGPVPDPRMFWSQKSSLNYSRFYKPELEALIEKGSCAATIEEKESINRKVGDILADEVAWIYLSKPNLLIAHQKDIKNIILGSQADKGISWNNFLINARSWRK